MWELRVRLIQYLIVFAAVVLIGSFIAMVLGARFVGFPLAMIEVIHERPLDVLFYATPLILSAIAVSVAGQAGLLNIGVEGQLYLGAFLAGIVGHDYFLPTGLASPLRWLLLLLLSMGIPGLLAAFAGYAKTKFGVHEVLTTLFTTFAVLAVLNYLVNIAAIRDSTSGPQTRSVLDIVQLQPWLAHSRLNWGFGWALGSVVLSWLLLYKTPIGLRIRGAGDNSSVHSGLGYSLTVVYTGVMFLSGAIAGLVGVQRVLGQDLCYVDNFSPGYGFIGLGIAFAARNSPIDVFVIACAFALLQATGATLNYNSSISKEFVDFVQVSLLVALVLVVKTKGRVK